MLIRNLLAFEKAPLLFSLCLHGAFFSFAYYGFEKSLEKDFLASATQIKVNAIPLVFIQDEIRVTKKNPSTKKQKKSTPPRPTRNSIMRSLKNAPPRLSAINPKSQELTSAQPPRQNEVTLKSPQPVKAEYSLGSPQNPLPEYPLEALQNGYEGITHIKVRIDEDGRPVGTKIDQSSGYSCLDASALKALKTWIFIPSHRGGKNIESELTVPIKFVLDDPD
ncbi:MAG: energy transducer TonB [Alphaproteobacteria bacterium]|nr:energy transducer TonB [Alphaproteobacteria bacterium]